MDDNQAAVSKFIDPKLAGLLKETLAQDSKAVEQEFDNIIDGMISTGMLPEESRQTIHDRITEDITAGLMMRLVRVLDEDDKKRLQELYHSGLSEYQQLQVILKLYLKKAGEPLEETMINLYDQAIKQFISEYHNLKVSMHQVVKLSDDECDKIDAMIEAGDWNEALEELENLTGGRSEAPTGGKPAPETPDESPKSEGTALHTQVMSTDELNRVVEMLRSGKYEEAKQAMDDLSAE